FVLDLALFVIEPGVKIFLAPIEKINALVVNRVRLRLSGLRLGRGWSGPTLLWCVKTGLGGLRLVGALLHRRSNSSLQRGARPRHLKCLLIRARVATSQCELRLCGHTYCSCLNDIQR